MLWAAAAASPSTDSLRPIPDPSLPNAKLVGLRFEGGDDDGFSIGWRVDANGKTFAGFMPSKPNASPLPTNIAPLVSGLIKAYERGQKQKYAQFVSPNAKTYLSCLYCDDSLPFVEHEFRVPKTERLTLNTPYLMKPGSAADFDYAVRLEWLRDGQLEYTSELIIANGKVRDVITSIPHIPPIAPPPSSQAAASVKKPAPLANTAGPYMTAWAACMSAYALPRLSGLSTDAIVEGGFNACSKQEEEVRAADIHDLGPQDGPEFFRGIKARVRGVMLRRVTQAKEVRGYK